MAAFVYFTALMLVSGRGMPADAAKAWRQVGGPTSVPAAYPALAVHPQGSSGTPLLAFASAEQLFNTTLLRTAAAYAQVHTPFGWLPLGSGIGSTSGTFFSVLSFPAAPAAAQHLCVSLHPKSGAPFVAFRDPDAGGALSLYKWNGSEWTFLGLPRALVGLPGALNSIRSFISSVYGGTAAQKGAAGALDSTSASVDFVNLDSNSQQWGPVVCFQDAGSGGRVSCMRYVNGPAPGLAYIGPRGFTPGVADYVSMAVRGGTIYVAFQDTTTSKSQGRVMRWVGTTASKWERVGGPFSAGAAAHISLAVHPLSGLPWVLFQGSAPGVAASPDTRLTAVTPNNKGQWKSVGPSGFAGTGSVYNSLAFEPRSRLPWAAFQCGGKLCVRSWTGAAWRPVGPQPLSKGQASYIRLLFHGASRTPYVSYSDMGVGGGAAVVRRWV